MNSHFKLDLKPHNRYLGPCAQWRDSEKYAFRPNKPSKWMTISSHSNYFTLCLKEAHLIARLRMKNSSRYFFLKLSSSVCFLHFSCMMFLAWSFVVHTLQASHCWSSMLCFRSRSRSRSGRRRWWRWRGKERGGLWGVSGVCASVSQTCSSNGLYYLLLFAVCCNQAPEWRWSRKLLRFFSPLLPRGDGDGLKHEDKCKVASRKQVGTLKLLFAILLPFPPTSKCWKICLLWKQ